MSDTPSLIARALRPWQSALLDSIDSFRLHRPNKPFTIVLAGDSLGHVNVIEGRPLIAKIKIEPPDQVD